MAEIDRAKATSDMLDYLYSDVRDISYAHAPSNLTEPLKVNEKYEFKSQYDPWKLKSMLWAQEHQPSASL